MGFCVSEDAECFPALNAQPHEASNWPGRLLIAGIVFGVALFLHYRGHAVPALQPDVQVIPSGDLMGFVKVPAGPFIMGSDKSIDPMSFENERWSPAEARGSLVVPEFYIGRHEVTVGQFQTFAAATGRTIDPQASAVPPTHPVAFATWPEALAYCRWLEQTMKSSDSTPASLKTLLDAGWHVTLPSEAEWEKAARGIDGRRYPWGETPRRDRANFMRGGTVPVGSISCPECAYGLADMSGNVWEWTRSPLQPYPYNPDDDVDTVGEDALWVIRGGSFKDNEQMVRGSARGAADPGVRRDFIGFRVALTSVVK
jgi:formylglycine-generating enzyme required for sulfatase activity